MEIEIKRVYEKPATGDGYRVLVDRIWPRGVAKAGAAIDLWLKEAAPSTELRRWFGHMPARWEEFRVRYFEELRDSPASLAPLIERLDEGRVTLLYAARDERLNNAVALREYLDRMGRGRKKRN